MAKVGFGAVETASDRELTALRRIREAAIAYLNDGTTANYFQLQQAVEATRNDGIALPFIPCGPP